MSAVPLRPCVTSLVRQPHIGYQSLLLGPGRGVDQHELTAGVVTIVAYVLGTAREDGLRVAFTSTITFSYRSKDQAPGAEAALVDGEEEWDADLQDERRSSQTQVERRRGSGGQGERGYGRRLASTKKEHSVGEG